MTLSPPKQTEGSVEQQSNGEAVPPHEMHIILKPGSLLVFEHDAYEHWMHGIAELEEDIVSQNAINQAAAGIAPGAVIERGRRVSLTIRRVLRLESGAPM